MKTMKRILYSLGIMWLLLFVGLRSGSQPNTSFSSGKIDSVKQLLKADKEDTVKVAHLLLLSNYLSVANTDTAILLSREACRISELLHHPASIGQSFFQLALNYKFKSDYPNSLSASFKALSVFEQLDKKSISSVSTVNKDWMMKILSNIGLVYTLKGEYQHSLEYELKAIQLAEQTGNEALIINLSNQVGINYKELGNYLKAHDYFFNALKKAEARKETKLAMLSMTYIAGVFVLHKDYPNALTYYSRALKIAEQDWKEQVLVIKLNMTNVYAKQGDNDKALATCFKVLNDEKNLNKYYQSVLYNLISDIYENQHMHELAIQYDQNALKIAEDIGDKKGIATSLNSIGKLMLLTKNYQEAESMLKLALAVSDSIHLLKLKLETEQALSELYKQTQREHKELEYLKKSISSNDSLYNVDKEKEMTRKEMNYEFEKKEALAKAANERKELIAKQQIQTQKLIRNSLVVGFILLAMLILVVINRNKLKRKMELEQMRSRLSRDLHDDIGSTLSSINILSRTAQRNAQLAGDEKTKETLEKINERSQRLLSSMSDIIWNINPANDNMDEVISRMREYATTVLEANQIDYEIHFPREKQDCKISMQAKNNLYLIFKEAVNNLVKYAACQKAIIELSVSDQLIQLKVEDDGVGFDINTLHHQGGLRNMKYRAEEINGMLEIVSEKGKGTKIQLTIH